jgi:hypothetical protein
MRILLDECLPKDFAGELAGHPVKTVPQAGWAGVSNGELLKLIAASGHFDLFLTMDKQLPQQNKMRELPFAIIVIRAKTNRLEHVRPFASLLLLRLDEFKAGSAYVLTLPE